MIIANLTLCGTGETHRSSGRATAISKLTDNVLLEIFDFYRSHSYTYPGIWKWHVLTHVCLRWRQIVFASPLRLHLRIRCTRKTPVKKSLGIWPAFPIVIEYGDSTSRITSPDEDDVIAALEHPDRVCALGIHLTGWQLRWLSTTMQVLFPVLTRLSISSRDGEVPTLPDGFLGRSAPLLRVIDLSGIPFPALPTLLLSTRDLVELKLHKIPAGGYISPSAMVVGLAALPKLQYLSIHFGSTNGRDLSENVRDLMRDHLYLLDPTVRTILPALTSFFFYGMSEYLENFTARICAPRLNSIKIYYLNQLVDFQVSQVSRFIDSSETLQQSLPMRCRVTLQPSCVSFDIGATGDKTERWEASPRIDVCIQCQGIDWQVSCITQALKQIPTVHSDVVHLTVDWSGPRCQLEDIDDAEWLNFLRSFTSVQTLYVSGQLAGHIASSLEDTPRAEAAEVLPALNLLCLEDQPVSSVGKLVGVLRDTVTIVNTQRNFD